MQVRLHHFCPPAWHVTGALDAELPIKIEDFKGKWLLVEFWGFSCYACLTKSLPELAAFHAEFQDQIDHFQIISFNLDRDVESEEQLTARLAPIVKAAWKGKKLPFPTLIDETAKTQEAYGISGFPTIVLVDPKGHVVKDGNLEDLREALESLRR